MQRRASCYFLLLLIVACDRVTAPPPPTPTPGSVKITANTTGLDMAAAVVRIDGVLSRVLSPKDSVIIGGLSPGTHSVLAEVSANCTVQGPNPQVVQVTDNAVSPVQFLVVCVAQTGVIEVTTVTMGLDAPVLYSLSVDNTGSQFLLASGTKAILGVAGGSHAVALGGLPANCSVGGGGLRDVSVAVGGSTRDTARVAFGMTCNSTSGVIEIAFNASGYDFGDTFRVNFGIGAPRDLAPNTTTRVDVAVGQYAIQLLVPNTCTAVGSDATTVVVSASSVARDTARAGFQVTCTAGELIAFNRDTGIFVVRPDGSHVTLVTDGYQPTWAPDRGRMAFTRTWCDYYYGCYGLGVAVLDYRSGTKSVTSLTNQADYNPAWSPNGSTIAFVRGVKLFHIRPDGSGMAPIPIPNLTSVASRIAWSSDGLRLAFGCREGFSEFEDICVVKADGTGFARLTSDGRRNYQPAWSPDGTLIAFVRQDFQSQRDSFPQPYIALMQPDGTGFTRLAVGTDPAWSHDGKSLVFRNFDPGGLATIKADGTVLTQVTTNSNDSAPAWRP